MGERFIEFWLLMFVAELIVPLTMFGFGRYFMRSAPKRINIWLSDGSDENKDPGTFVPHYCEKIWFYSKLSMLSISIIVMALVFGKNANWMNKVGLAFWPLPLIPLMESAVLTERVLEF